MNVKKILALLLALMLVLSMAACGSDEKADDKKDGEQTSTTTPNTNAGTTTTPNDGVPTTPNTDAPEADDELTVQQAIIGTWEGTASIPMEEDGDIIDLDLVAEITATTVKFIYSDEAYLKMYEVMGGDMDISSEKLEANIQAVKEEIEAEMQGSYELSDDCIMSVEGEEFVRVLFDGPDAISLSNMNGDGTVANLARVE